MQRRERLQELLNTRFDGKQADLARALKRSPSQINQWLSGHRVVGDAGARHIEMTLGLPAGWMDSDSPANQPAAADSAPVPMDPFPAISEMQLALVIDTLQQALKMKREAHLQLDVIVQKTRKVP